MSLVVIPGHQHAGDSPVCALAGAASPCGRKSAWLSDLSVHLGKTTPFSVWAFREWGPEGRVGKYRLWADWDLSPVAQAQRDFGGDAHPSGTGDPQSSQSVRMGFSVGGGGGPHTVTHPRQRGGVLPAPAACPVLTQRAWHLGGVSRLCSSVTPVATEEYLLCIYRRTQLLGDTRKAPDDSDLGPGYGQRVGHSQWNTQSRGVWSRAMPRAPVD